MGIGQNMHDRNDVTKTASEVREFSTRMNYEVSEASNLAKDRTLEGFFPE